MEEDDLKYKLTANSKPHSTWTLLLRLIKSVNFDHQMVFIRCEQSSFVISLVIICAPARDVKELWAANSKKKPLTMLLR